MFRKIGSEKETIIFKSRTEADEFIDSLAQADGK